MAAVYESVNEIEYTDSLLSLLKSSVIVYYHYRNTMISCIEDTAVDEPTTYVKLQFLVEAVGSDD
jgi:hypothetical protein